MCACLTKNTVAYKKIVRVCASVAQEGYAKLASLSHSRGWKLYKLRPKAHMMVHIALNLSVGELGLSPLSTSCWQDEDFIGRVSRLNRTVHPLLGSLRTIQKSLGCYKAMLRS